MLTEPPTLPSTSPEAASQAEAGSLGSRRIVFVAGSGRSGTSTLSGALQQLGLHVPGPEVPPDESNPKGFAESQWVVDFHDELLRRTGVHVSDGRPQAWYDTGRVDLNEKPRSRVHRWLEQQFADADELLIKDPRLAWFIGLWRVAAVRSEVEPAFVTMLRPPVEVVRSKERNYAGRLGNVGRTVAWINMMLHTERATRGSHRVFLRYHDLLDDWTSAIYFLGETFDIQSVKQADVPTLSRVHDFIDPSLHRSAGTWDGLEVPPPVRDLAEETWVQLNRLVDTPGEDTEVTEALDQLRAEYSDFYAEAEAVVKSSIMAERLAQTARADRAIIDAQKAAEADARANGAASKVVARGTPVRVARSRADRLARHIPHNLRALVPGALRRRARALVDQRR